MTLQEKLNDARQKLHLLVTGSLRVTVHDGDVTVTYDKANKGDLEQYIRELERQLAAEQGHSAPRRRPAGAIF